MQVGQKTSMVLFKVQAGLDLNARWILDDAQEISWQTPEGNNGNEGLLCTKYRVALEDDGSQ